MMMAEMIEETKGADNQEEVREALLSVGWA